MQTDPATRFVAGQVAAGQSAGGQRRRAHNRIARMVPSSTWLEDFDARSVPFPPKPESLPASPVMPRGMVLSAQKVTTFIDVGQGATLRTEPQTERRWTPRPCVDLEDELDAMTPREARDYSYPESPSARVIADIASARGLERRGRRRKTRDRGVNLDAI